LVRSLYDRSFSECEEAFSCCTLHFYAYSLKVVTTSNGSGILSKACQHGLTTIKQAANTQKKLRDSKHIDVIDRLEKMLNSPEAEGLVWHKTCYAHFMDKSKLERLQSLKLRQRILNLKQAAVIGLLVADVHCERGWSHNWNLCIFCQTEVPKARLISVMSKQMSDH